jgi:hypothetical protein
MRANVLDTFPQLRSRLRLSEKMSGSLWQCAADHRLDTRLLVDLEQQVPVA